jgi:hypothetical protein
MIWVLRQCIIGIYFLSLFLSFIQSFFLSFFLSFREIYYPNLVAVLF